MDFYRRHELPETVRRYKTDTNQFQEWLIKVATTRGVELAQQISGLAKKEKKKRGYKMSVEQQERLVDAIAEANDTLADTSGLLHLGDAIRYRKEIAQYYKLTNQVDEGHTYFNGFLGDCMTTLSKLVPTFRKAQDLDDEASNIASNFLVINFSLEDSGENDDDDQDDDDGDDENHQRREQSDASQTTTPVKNFKDTSFTQQERDLQQEYLILGFLYEFNLIRQIVRDVWQLYRRGLVNAITAALVTDLAQSHIQQSVAGLIEDIDIARGKLLDAIQALHTKISTRPRSGARAATKKEPQEHVVRDHLCIESIRHIYNYLYVKDKSTNPTNQVTQSDHRVQVFLQFFASIRSQKIALPIWDKFTETVLRHATDSMDWLPFGLQIIIDIQAVIHDVNHTLLRDITEHSLDISRLMQIHIEYEDRMWAAGNKPDYSTKEVFKFSTMFLPPLKSMLAWVQRLLPSPDSKPNKSHMTTDTFVTIHSTLAGLAMWQHNKQYHSTAIDKVQWFIIFLCHIYNAARQLGGLEIAWPDLDFLIQTHGPGRIFIGAPPKHPDDFLDHYLLAIGISAEYMAADYRNNGRPFCPLASREVRKKRGLKPHFPLEEKIKIYYGPDSDKNRFLKRHNIFHHLFHQATDIDDPNTPEADEALKQVEELRHTFSSIAAHLCPPKPKNKRKKATRVPAPDFSKVDETHASLLSKMKTELQSHELHNNFDYLSFYRHAYDLVLKVRGEILYDDDTALARRTNIKKDPDPNHHQLLLDFFRSLKTQARNSNIKTTGDEVSRDVVPLDQLKRIAKMMEGFIRESGAIELGRAKMRMSRDWDGLKASYAAEEVARQKSDPEVGNVADDEHPNGHKSEIHADGDSPTVRPTDRKEEFGKIKEQAKTGTMPETDNIWARLSGQEPCNKTLKESDKRPTYQAYVTDEADEVDGTKEAVGSTTYLEDQDPVFQEKRCLATTMEGKSRSSEIPNPMFQFRALDGRSIQVDNQEMYVDQVARKLKAMKKPKRTSRAHVAPKPVAQTKVANKAPEISDPVKATTPSPSSPSPSKPGSKSKRSGYPKGIFHRLTFSHRASRKHVATLQRSSTTARLALTRKRPTYTKNFYLILQQAARRHQRQFTVTRKKQYIALPCYASCCMARALLGKETKLQCRVGKAGKAARAKVWESESDRDRE